MGNRVSDEFSAPFFKVEMNREEGSISVIQNVGYHIPDFKDSQSTNAQYSIYIQGPLNPYFPETRRTQRCLKRKINR